MTTANTDWIRKGAKVAELVRSRNRGASGVHPATITDVTPTTIKLDNGNRYSRKTLNPTGKNNTGAAGYLGAVLVPIAHPEVQRSVALKRLEVVASLASRLHRDGAGSVNDVLDALDEIEQAALAAHQAITADMANAARVAEGK